MGTIDDFGDTTEPLNQPVFGGPSGWAAAVRDYLLTLMPKSGGAFTGRFGIKQGTVSGVNLAADTDFGAAGPTLMVVNEAGTDYAQVAVSADGPQHPQHATPKSYVDKIAQVIDLPAGGDLNWQIKENAIFTGYNLVNAPAASIMIIRQYVYSPDWFMQVAHLPGENSIWHRSYNNGTTWTAWKQAS
jgi:hypothetical protein